MQEEIANKRKCIRDHPSCWIPQPSQEAAVQPILPPQARDPPSCWIPQPGHVVAQPVALPPQWHWPVENVNGSNKVEVGSSNKFRHAGLLREEGGVAAVLARARAEGRSWL
jgi:hypothetical protein